MTRRDSHWPTTLGLLVVAGASFLAIWPLLAVPFPSSHDGIAHVFRLVELDRAIQQGILFPRWIPTLLFGYGYPLFNFMPSLVHYIAELFHATGFSVLTALKATLMLGIATSGFAMFFFVRDIAGRLAAVVSAVAYIFLPYALYDIYERMALSEAFSFVFLPLILWAVHRIVERQSFLAAIWGAFALAGLALTHQSALLAVAFSAVYLTFLVAGQCVRRVVSFNQMVRRIGIVVLFYALGFGLSAFLWLPALLEQKFVYMGTLAQGDRQFFDLLYQLSDLVQPSLFYQFFAASPPHIRIGLVQALVAVGSMAVAWRIRPSLRPTILASLAMSLLPLLLMTHWSAPLWDFAPTLTLMSFPSRLLMFVGLGTSILAGLFAAEAPQGTAGKISAAERSAGLSLQPRSLTRLCHLWRPAIGLGVILLLAASGFKNLAAEPLDIDNSSLTRTALARFESGTSFIGLTMPTQVLPVWVQVPSDKIPFPELEGSGGVQDVSPFERIEVQAMNGWHLKARVLARRSGRLIWHAFYFPGWEGAVDTARMPVEPYGPLGLVSIEVPEGEHMVEISFADTWPRQIGRIATTLASMVVATIAAACLIRGVRPLRWRAGLLPPILVFGLAPLALALMSAPRPAASQIVPLSIEVNGMQTLVGWQPRTDRLARLGMLELSFYWHVRRTSSMDQVEWIRLTDQDGRSVTEISARPNLGNGSTTRWAPGEVVEDRQDIPWPADAPPGLYHVDLALVNRTSGQEDEEKRPPYVHVGEIRISQDVRTGSEREKLIDAPVAVFADHLALRSFLLDGKPLDGTRRLKPGDRVEVQLFWQALAPISEDYSVFLHLSDRKGSNLAQTDSYPQVDLRLTSQWRPGVIVRHRYWLTVPRQAQTGVYELATGLYSRNDLSRLSLSGAGDEDRFVLARLRVDADGAVPPPKNPFDARFANGIRLSGWTSLPKTGQELVAERGTSIPLTLFWWAEANIDRDYTVFVHIVDAQGRPVSQVDREPLDGRLPTSAWLPGDKIVDRYELTLPSSLPIGEYHLLVGLYSLPEARRAVVSYQGRDDDKASLSLIKVVD